MVFYRVCWVGVAALLLATSACSSAGSNASDTSIDAPVDAFVPPMDVSVAEDTETSVSDAPPQEVQKPEQLPDPPTPCVVFTPDADDPSQALFDPSCVVDVQVQLNPEDWETLRKQTRTGVEIVRGDCLSELSLTSLRGFKRMTVSGKFTRTSDTQKAFLVAFRREASLKIRFDKYGHKSLRA